MQLYVSKCVEPGLGPRYSAVIKSKHREGQNIQANIKLDRPFPLMFNYYQNCSPCVLHFHHAFPESGHDYTRKNEYLTEQLKQNVSNSHSMNHITSITLKGVNSLTQLVVRLNHFELGTRQGSVLQVIKLKIRGCSGLLSHLQQ